MIVLPMYHIQLQEGAEQTLWRTSAYFWAPNHVHAHVHVFTFMCTHTPALTCALRHTYSTSDCKLRHSKYFHIRGNIIEYVSLNVGSLAIYLVQLLTSRYHQASYRFEIINCQFYSFLVIYI